MTPRLRKTLTYAGYPAFYVLALLVFADLTFPNDKLARFIEAEFNSRQVLGSGVRLDVDHASLYWLSGVELEGVRLIREHKEQAEASDAKPSDSKKPPKAAASSKKPAPPKTPDAPPAPDIEHAHVGISLLRWLVGTQHVTFGAEAFGGEMAGIGLQS